MVSPDHDAPTGAARVTDDDTPNSPPFGFRFSFSPVPVVKLAEAKTEQL